MNTITGGAGADTINGGAGADTFVYAAAVGANQAAAIANLTAEGGDTITDFVTAADSIEFSEALLDAIIGAATFAAGDVLGVDAGAFLEIIATDSAGAADAAATATAGTFIYDSNTGILIFDASGDTIYTDDGTGFTDAAGDDIVIATIQVAGVAGGLGSIVATDFVFV